MLFLGIAHMLSMSAETHADISIDSTTLTVDSTLVTIDSTNSGTSPAQPPVRVNLGGSNYTDSLANTWAADFGCDTGNPTSVSTRPIAATSDDLLFLSHRWDDSSAPEMTCSYVVQPGEYEVALYFAETNENNFSAGARVFDVTIEGITVFDDVDVYREVGGNTALVKTTTVTVGADAQIDIQFLHQTKNPVIKAVEVRPLGSDGDLDGDGLSDSLELLIGTDETKTDTDGDGLSDFTEVAFDGDETAYVAGQDLDPLSTDTDADGISDQNDPAPLDYSPADGDLAPLGAPDGVINVADLLIAQRIALGTLTLPPEDLIRGDLYPPGSPDGQINTQDLILLQQLILQTN